MMNYIRALRKRKWRRLTKSVTGFKCFQKFKNAQKLFLFRRILLLFPSLSLTLEFLQKCLSPFMARHRMILWPSCLSNLTPYQGAFREILKLLCTVTISSLLYNEISYRQQNSRWLGNITWNSAKIYYIGKTFYGDWRSSFLAFRKLKKNYSSKESKSIWMKNCPFQTVLQQHVIYHWHFEHFFIPAYKLQQSLKKGEPFFYHFSSVEYQCFEQCWQKLLNMLITFGLVSLVMK